MDVFIFEHLQNTETRSVPKSLFNKRAEGKYVPRRCTLLKTEGKQPNVSGIPQNQIVCGIQRGIVPFNLKSRLLAPIEREYVP